MIQDIDTVAIFATILTFLIKRMLKMCSSISIIGNSSDAFTGIYPTLFDTLHSCGTHHGVIYVAIGF